MADGLVIIPNEGRVVWLQSGSGGITASGEARFFLFQSATTIDLDSVFADLTEATYSGYARLGITLGGVFLNGDGLQEQDWSPANFAHDGGPDSNDIYGWGLGVFIGGAVTLMAAQNFDPPRSMAVNGDVIPVVVNSLFHPFT